MKIKTFLMLSLSLSLLGCGGSGSNNGSGGGTVQPATYSISANVSGGGGTLTPQNQSIVAGNNAQITLNPTQGFSISTNVSGASGNCQGSFNGNRYIINNVQSNCNLTFSFNQSSDGGGTVLGGFCLDGYCNGEEPLTYTLRGQNQSVTAHFQGFKNSNLEFNYKTNNEFGDLDSVSYSVRTTSGSLIDSGEANIDFYYNKITLPIARLQNLPNVIRISLNAKSTSDETSSVNYLVSLINKSYGSWQNGVMLHPFNRFNIFEYDKQYNFELSTLDDYFHSGSNLNIVIINVQDTRTRNCTGMEVERFFTCQLNPNFEWDNNNLNIRFTSDLAWWEQRWIYESDQMLTFEIVYNLYDNYGNKIYDQPIRSRVAYMVQYPDHFFEDENGSTVQARYFKLLEDFEKALSITAAHLEYDNILEFWRFVFDANGYEQILNENEYDDFTKVTNELYKKMIHKVSAALFPETVSRHIRTPSLLNTSYRNFSNIESFVNAEIAFVFGEDFREDGSWKSSWGAITLKSIKIDKINEYINQYNEINNTNFGLIKPNNTSYIRLVHATNHYSYLFDNEYGEFNEDGYWYFYNEYSYLNGVHNRTYDWLLNDLF